ncbi:hypothetical protein ACSBR1_019298 [Camellia fascicularis]
MVSEKVVSMKMRPKPIPSFEKVVLKGYPINTIEFASFITRLSFHASTKLCGYRRQRTKTTTTTTTTTRSSTTTTMTFTINDDDNFLSPLTTTTIINVDLLIWKKEIELS